MNTLATQLENFVHDFGVATQPPVPETLAQQLARFIGQFPVRVPVEVIKPVEPEIDWGKTREQLSSFLHIFGYMQERYNREIKPLGGDIDFWKLSQIGSDEVRNTGVLAWLLDARGDHGQGNAILAGLLCMLAQRHGVLGNFPREENCHRPYRVRVESCPMGDQESRVDIEIDGEDFLLFIEVKINAPETNKQLDRYLEIAAAKSRGRPYGIIFLDKKGLLPIRFGNEKKMDGSLLAISWKELSVVIKNQIQVVISSSLSARFLRGFVGHINGF